MSQPLTDDRARAIQPGQAEEFATFLPTITVETCLKECLLAYNEAHIRDFVPLPARRESRARVTQIACQEPRAAM